jgi:phage shock protein PspC (stress-responsive transcriptional regulator)
MQATRQNLFTRDDTFFGVCEALGEDFRFPANLLRVAFALLFFWNPVVVIGVYLAIGVLVAMTRFIAPNPRMPAQVEDPRAALPSEAASNDRPAEELAEAA